MPVSHSLLWLVHFVVHCGSRLEASHSADVRGMCAPSCYRSPPPSCPARTQGFTSEIFFPIVGEHITASDAYGSAVNYISSAVVLPLTRSFYGCSSAVGAQLEDQGGSGSADSHWDYRIFNVSRPPFCLCMPVYLYLHLYLCAWYCLFAHVGAIMR